jgi:hypothetical protein
MIFTNTDYEKKALKLIDRLDVLYQQIRVKYNIKEELADEPLFQQYTEVCLDLGANGIMQSLKEMDIGNVFVEAFREVLKDYKEKKNQEGRGGGGGGG